MQLSHRLLLREHKQEESILWASTKFFKNEKQLKKKSEKPAAINPLQQLHTTKRERKSSGEQEKVSGSLILKDEGKKLYELLYKMVSARSAEALEITRQQSFHDSQITRF